MKIFQHFVLAAMIVLTSGCTIMDGNTIVTGKERSPISPNEVRLYREAPEKYEEIAIVTASAGHDFKKNSSLMNAAIERAKEEAAKLGANGIILTRIQERDAPEVTTSFGAATARNSYGGSAYATGTGTSVNRGDAHTRISGVAVYVP